MLDLDKYMTIAGRPDKQVVNRLLRLTTEKLEREMTWEVPWRRGILLRENAHCYPSGDTVLIICSSLCSRSTATV
jgi:hypothetical protein